MGARVLRLLRPALQGGRELLAQRAHAPVPPGGHCDGGLGPLRLQPLRPATQHHARAPQQAGERRGRGCGGAPCRPAVVGVPNIVSRGRFGEAACGRIREPRPAWQRGPLARRLQRLAPGIVASPDKRPTSSDVHERDHAGGGARLEFDRRGARDEDSGFSTAEGGRLAEVGGDLPAPAGRHISVVRACHRLPRRSRVLPLVFGGISGDRVVGRRCAHDLRR
mmetsp:Transcript_58537/g.164154  ORF Transcript_58537/g.164154 Transcript_58537/m.164154 type:complete len:222 (+) Transcript_58537:135-800(+)